ncbi:GntP family permease [Deinococcus lacus]|uniref:GntP family permease n=1 Tax=Deinococcus lacus TaxID=392561 RepID=A0ABW1YG41_9DEIO
MLSQLGPLLLGLLLLCIALIIGLTARWKLHPFLSIVAATYVFGLGANLLAAWSGYTEPVIPDVTKALTDGFGSIISGIGLVILFGTIIGKLMERSGAAITLADALLRRFQSRPALAMSVVGWVTSIPVFCDSGFVILSSLQKSIARKTGVSSVTLGTALATGLYASHTFIPPTPGPIAAAGNLGIGAGGLIWVILFGAFVSAFAAAAGYFWAVHGTRGLTANLDGVMESFEEYRASFSWLPGLGASLAPLLVPIALMALGSLANFPAPAWRTPRCLRDHLKPS